MFCEFSDIFGKPNVGAHSIRIPIVDLAFVDTIGTVVVGYFVYNLWFKNVDPYLYIICVILFVVFIHKLFCVETRFNRALWL